MPISYNWPLTKMAKWYKDGLGCREIAKKLTAVTDQFGVTHKPSAGGVARALRKFGTKMRITGAGLIGKKNPAWVGGRRINDHGYVEVRMPGHHRAHASGYVFEHILVAERVLGRRLRPRERVHHEDDNRQNNAPSNLIVYPSNGQHLKETLKGKRPNWSEDGRRRIVAASRKRAKKQRAATKQRKLAELNATKKCSGIRLG